MEKPKMTIDSASFIASYAERIIGYIYAGLLPLLILTIEEKSIVKGCVDTTGAVLLTLICIGLGVGVFSIYFKIVGELFLYPLQHIFHILFDFIVRRSGDKRSSTVGLLVHFGVPILRARDAYQTIKDEYFQDFEKIEIQISHGELHVVYLTSLITFLTYIILEYFRGNASSIYLYLSIISLLAGIISDSRQHSKESSRIRAHKRNIIVFLKEKGFIDSNII